MFLMIYIMMLKFLFIGNGRIYDIEKIHYC